MSTEKTTSLSKHQVEDLARPFVSMVDRIKAFYEDPKNERDFQDWYGSNNANLKDFRSCVFATLRQLIDVLSDNGKLDKTSDSGNGCFLHTRQIHTDIIDTAYNRL